MAEDEKLIMGMKPLHLAALAGAAGLVYVMKQRSTGAAVQALPAGGGGGGPGGQPVQARMPTPGPRADGLPSNVIYAPPSRATASDPNPAGGILGPPLPILLDGSIAPLPASDLPTIYAAARNLYQALIQNPYGPNYLTQNPQLVQLVNQFEQAIGLPVDGLYGPITAGALYAWTNGPRQTDQGTPAPAYAHSTWWSDPLNPIIAPWFQGAGPRVAVKYVTSLGTNVPPPPPGVSYQ